jgi:hypothetical protein
MSRRRKHKQQIESGWKKVIYIGVSGVWDWSLLPGKAETSCGVFGLAESFTHDRSLWVLTLGVSGLTGVSGL